MREFPDDATAARTRAWRAAVVWLMLLVGTLAFTTSARAATPECQDSWINTAGGDWQTPSDWSEGHEPSAGENVCITAPGTYTVTDSRTELYTTFGSIVVGGESGAQTLDDAVDCSYYEDLDAETVVIGAHGTIALTNTKDCFYTDSLHATNTILNEGRLESVASPEGDNRNISAGTIENKGTIAIGEATHFYGPVNFAGPTVANEGAIEIAPGANLEVEGSGTTVINGAGGSISASEPRQPPNLGLDAGLLVFYGKFVEGEGTISGPDSVTVDYGEIEYTGDGASRVTSTGRVGLAGSLGAGQELVVEGTCFDGSISRGTVLSLPVRFDSAGTIALTSGGCPAAATLSARRGSITTSSGTIITEPGDGGERTIEGSLTSTGTLEFNAGTVMKGTRQDVSLEGPLDVNAGALHVVGGTLRDRTGGAIDVAKGSSASLAGTQLYLNGGTLGGEGASTLEDGALHLTGGGPVDLELTGQTSFTGRVPAGSTLTLDGTCAQGALLQTSAPLTNDGTLALAHEAGCASSSTIAVEAEAGKRILRNLGRLQADPLEGGTDSIEAERLVNAGVLALPLGVPLSEIFSGKFTQSGEGTTEETSP